MRPSKKKMTDRKIDNLIQVKSVLIDKYISLATLANSRTKRRSFLHKVKKHRITIERLTVMQ